MDVDSAQKIIFIVAGEPSGDHHGAKLITAIKKIQSNISFTGHGGDKMAAAGGTIIEHINHLAIMGFSEVIQHLPRMIYIMKKTVETIKRIKPDRVILIDYPGFNLHLAKNIQKLNIPITYFILPQAWAWKEKRVERMKTILDQALSIFPFEKEWFETRGLPIKYIGHPFAERIPVKKEGVTFFQRHNLDPNDLIITLLPGSRQQEVNRHWPILLETVDLLQKKVPSLRAVVGKAPNVVLSPLPNYINVEGKARLAMAYGTVAITSSGTATLECALEGIPSVVCYKLSLFSWIILKYLSNVSYVSIVNLIARKQIVCELIQYKMTPNNLVNNIMPLLEKKSPERKKILDGYKNIRKVIGKPGVYERAAKAIVKRL